MWSQLSLLTKSHINILMYASANMPRIDAIIIVHVLYCIALRQSVVCVSVCVCVCVCVCACVCVCMCVCACVCV